MSLDRLSRQELIEIINRYQNYFRNGGVDTDVLTQLELIEKLRFTEERFRLTFYTSPDSININRASDGLYIDVNEGFCNLTGYTREEIIGKTSIEIDIWSDLKDRNELRRLLRENGKVTNYKAKFRMKNGEFHFALMSAIIIEINNVPHILSITKDIDRIVKMEEKLKKHQNKINQIDKIEAMAEMAGNLGHQFKNYITIIRNSVEILKAEGRLDDDLMNTVLNYTEKANLLSKDLIYIRKHSESLSHIKNINPNSVIIKLNSVFNRLGKKREIKNELHSTKSIEILEKDFEEILINLVINAVEATDPNLGRIKIITLDNIVNPFILYENNLLQKDCIRIIIEDNGSGIPASIKNRIFEPFFTKKESGSGLGLTIVHKLVTKYGGIIDIADRKMGTSFIIDLPLP